MTDTDEPLDYAELHARALRLCGKAVSHVTVADYEAPTPCADWNLHALLNHVVSENLWVRPLVEGATIADVGDRFAGDLLGREPIPAYEQSAADASSAFFAPRVMMTPCAVSYGPVPGSAYCAHRVVDLVIHGWDIAQAVGADYKIPADMIAAVRTIVGPQMDDMRAAGIVGPEVVLEVGDDEQVSEQVQLLAWFGRAGV